MLAIQPITKEFLAEAGALYTRAFPKNERIPFSKMLGDESGKSEVFIFLDENAFIGLACVANAIGISHITYLAVEDTQRDKGYGSQMLSLLCRQKSGKRIIVDIELPEKDAENEEQRLRRKAFYIRAGYKETDVYYHWAGEDYEILCYGGTITEKEFRNFWEELMG